MTTDTLLKVQLEFVISTISIECHGTFLSPLRDNDKRLPLSLHIATLLAAGTYLLTAWQLYHTVFHDTTGDSHLLAFVMLTVALTEPEP
jgi:hypothetical protein